MNRNVQQAAVSSSVGAAAVPKQDALRAEEWMTTAYTEYALYDLDQDTRTEIAVIQVDPAGTNSTVQLYGWRDGTFMIRDTVSLSAGIVSNGIRAGPVYLQRTGRWTPRGGCCGLPGRKACQSEPG